MSKLMNARKFRMQMGVGQKGAMIRSTSKYSKKEAAGSANLDYYVAMGKDIKQYAHRETEKLRLRTPKWDFFDQLVSGWKAAASTPSSTARILLGIYNANKKAALEGLDPPVHHNLLDLLAKPELLLMAYRKVRGNKGALAKGSWHSQEAWNDFTEEERLAILRTK